MTTTIQVAENLTISKYMEIDGVRCEVESASFTPAITIGQANEELLKVMADELIERSVIKEEYGQYYFCESGEPLIPDEDWDIEQIKADAPEGAVYWSPSVEQYFDGQFISLASKEDGKLIQVAEEFRSELVKLKGASMKNKLTDLNNHPQTTENNLLIEVASAIRELRRGSDREVKEDGEVVGYWQTPEFIEHLLEIAARCEQGLNHA